MQCWLVPVAPRERHEKLAQGCHGLTGFPRREYRRVSTTSGGIPFYGLWEVLCALGKRVPFYEVKIAQTSTFVDSSK